MPKVFNPDQKIQIVEYGGDKQVELSFSTLVKNFVGFFSNKTGK